MTLIRRGLCAAAIVAACGSALWSATSDDDLAWPCLASSAAPIWRPANCPTHVRDLRTSGALTAPDRPTNVAGSVSGARVTLAWHAPAAGDPPSSYMIEAGSATGRADLANFDSGSSTASLTADSVPTGTYFVRVRAKNGAGVSAPSNEVIVNVTGISACATRPNAPGTLSGSSSGSAVTLAWSAPTGGCAPTSYTIEAGSASGLSNLATLSTGSTATSFSASGVAAGTYYVRVRAANAAGQGTSTSNEVTIAVGSTPLTACSTWAGQQRGAGVPPAPGSFAEMRQALYDAGGGIKAVGSKYYAAYFPTDFSSGPRRVLIALHGTGGAPEQQWSIDWQSSVQSRGYGFLALKYLDDSTGVFDDENAIYANLKAMIDDVRASCDFGSATLFLVGFSRGSAESFPVSYLDHVDRRLLTAVGNNSGGWNLGGPPPPALVTMAARDDRTAMSGIRYWMYCGEQDFVQGFPMCEGMVQARDFVQTYGATVAALYRDPTGAHGGLTKNADALSQMFSYFESLR